MKQFFALVLVTVFALNVKGQSCAANEPKEARVLLIGDSWAFFMNTDQTINNTLRKWGHSNYIFRSNTIVSENGAETDDLLKPAKQAEIANLLNQNPSIDVVHVSIGGNDMLGDWKKSFTPVQTQALKASVFDRLQQIFDFIKSLRPGIKIFWAGYTYPNFEEVIQTSGLGSDHPFYSTWQKMEFPNFLEINTILNDVSRDMDSIAALDPQLEFVNATGLMQYTFGQNNNLAVAPGGNYPAFTAPLPLGFPDYPSPAGSMRNYLGLRDCFHLSAKGFSDFLDYHTQKFYHKFLMDDFYALAVGNSQSGSVSSTGNTSDTLWLGSVGAEEFATVLSFNTTGMLDTTLAKASIFLQRESLTGSNPIGNFTVRVKNGNFGVSATVEASDFSDAGDASGDACQYGSNGGNGHWIRLDLPTSLFPYINNNGNTQFVVSRPGFAGGRITFTGTANPEFAPVLNVAYGSPISSINEVAVNEVFKVFPNPAQGTINFEIEGQQVKSTRVLDLSGRQLLFDLTGAKSLNIAQLLPGLYLLQVQTDSGILTHRFVKE